MRNEDLQNKPKEVATWTREDKRALVTSVWESLSPEQMLDILGLKETLEDNKAKRQS